MYKLNYQRHIGSMLKVPPCLALCLLNRLGEYWYIGISLYVYDCNSPLAPILRQRQCSLMYDVY
jgi:hypothetical protein